MTTFWSIWITVITLGTILGVAVILWWCSRDDMGVKEGEDMGHEYDGIREINNPLPKWWAYMFWATIVGGLVYLVLFPGLGSFKGVLGWQSSDQTVRSIEESNAAIAAAQSNKSLDQYAKELSDADTKFGAIFKQLAYNDTGSEYRPITDIAQNPDAIKVGQRLFLQNCAQCHSSDARGQTGFPNLADNAWLYGGEAETIKTTVMHGREGVMPAWQETLGDDGVREVTSYVLSLSGRKVNAKEALAGKQRFVVCAACHGTDGKGNPAFGAPDLTDRTWLYGGSRKAVEATIAHGRQGIMPAWADILGEDKVQLISAYVWNLSNPTEQQPSN
ncbi:cytochrome-c oxidase, cbb3-type subunit III [Photobacterium lucens]|uniref:cytochrome-c oxidase, cbb3-type subunit III n=1 Tax=Photobacterium lucens TaxID=2562949 RepID=UPI001368D970|nr:cytochrome-c oxidase, cbb3-type subunit III [Photobacterium lucens]MBP2700305.1 cytochrome-c oxidase, cbb3-type subunit III [Vibrio parahaemolyticus]MZG58258.1 cytochrome-c oxidase, cbb3-type subunit III [Photobacterium lucens]MZG81535.1 cytochrome-c oxidase, cbb3-type subunit III [Photobacterium lucens]